jgi:hypothetical protein
MVSVIALMCSGVGGRLLSGLRIEAILVAILFEVGFFAVAFLVVAFFGVDFLAVAFFGVDFVVFLIGFFLVLIFLSFWFYLNAL